MRRQLILALVAIVTLLDAACQSGSQGQPSTASLTTWQLVRTVLSSTGESSDLVLVPKSHIRDLDFYRAAADAICLKRTSCMVHFWVDPEHVPQGAWMPVEDLQVMTADYERHPSYPAPVLRLACWLYAEDPRPRGEKCFFMPGVKVPWNTEAAAQQRDAAVETR